MEIVTAIGNEYFNETIKKEGSFNIIGPDIQYQEAVIDIINKEETIDLLILSTLLPGELNIYEFINIIKYKKPEIEIIIILEKKDEKLEQFIISKGINNIYYNNKITFEEIIKKINVIENKIKITENKIKEKINLKNNKKILFKLINKIKFFKNKNKKINKNKIITILGEPKIGKSIFSLIFCLNIKNKKILIIDNDLRKNDIEIVIGKKLKKSNNNITKWKKNIDILTAKNNHKDKKNFSLKKLNWKELLENYEVIIIDGGRTEDNLDFIKISDQTIVLVEGNLLGINEAKKILSQLVLVEKIQKDNIKIVFNKQKKTSVPCPILYEMFSDFDILGVLPYDKFYDFFINKNTKFINKKTKNRFTKMANKLLYKNKNILNKR